MSATAHQASIRPFFDEATNTVSYLVFDPATRQARNASRRVTRSITELTRALGRPPEEEEIADSLGLDLDRRLDGRRDRRRHALLQLRQAVLRRAPVRRALQQQRLERLGEAGRTGDVGPLPNDEKLRGVAHGGSGDHQRFKPAQAQGAAGGGPQIVATTGPSLLELAGP